MKKAYPLRYASDIEFFADADRQFIESAGLQKTDEGNPSGQYPVCEQINSRHQDTRLAGLIGRTWNIFPFVESRAGSSHGEVVAMGSGVAMG